MNLFLIIMGIIFLLGFSILSHLCGDMMDFITAGIMFLIAMIPISILIGLLISDPLVNAKDTTEQQSEPANPVIYRIKELDELLSEGNLYRILSSDLLDEACDENNIDTLPVSWQPLANKLCFSEQQTHHGIR